ncbi:HTTM domain-containing protein [Micromonospora sp. 15K316]|uniref:HTTM domain-containing protein n=1 Tax=Micromonospora sp. 15K316 TaxID=2530376 RepID=UPI001FB715FF|nr:HTTM domain-containing protein [Micromonospora sp. 15K316]
MIRWLTEPVPRGRLAAFRTLIYLFVAADLVFFTPWVRTRVSVPGELYQPLLAGRLLPLPTPTPELVAVIFWALLGLALLAATGRAPRLLGWSVFALYLEWMIVAMSYGKVDHDRFGLLVALAVLPTAGRARHGDLTRCQAAGWALRVTQIAVVCTYFLAAWAKLRFGGLDWLTGSVLARAIIRRGTELADLIAQVPYLLIVAQFGIIAFELASPVVFLLPARWRSLTVGFFYSFHLVTFATITISFAPHLAAMTSFLPLERVRPIQWLRGLRRRGSPAALGQLGEHPLTAADDDLGPAPLGQPEQGVLGPVPPTPLGLGGGLPEPPHTGVVLDAEPGGESDPVPTDQPPRLRGNLGVEPEPGVA